MRTLVTGSAGYIGSHATNALLKSGFDVVSYDNLSTGFRSSIPEHVQFIEGDVRDTAKLTKALRDNKIEAVIHFAAKLKVPESLTLPLDYYDNNISGTISLIQACRSAGVDKVIFSSTAAVYGTSNGDKGLVHEGSIISPINPYGSSKLMAEKILADAEPAHGIRSVALRYFNVAGAALDGKNGQRTADASHLIKVASEAAVGKRHFVQVFGTDYATKDGSAVRDYIHVEDLIDAHLLALGYLRDGGSSQVLNCGYGKGYTVLEVLETMKRISGASFSISHQNRRTGDAPHLVADATKLRNLLGWTPQRDDLELICRTSYEWEKRQSTAPA
ncbi:UDP-glucose 4-epimerase GalE [Bdellovibrio reynosensis]|uniref:UDP-glucose 4-epimerase n=1 Tax=Bdellovibrio reynosensis TaxID=2835041 RepID=A0ABY4CD92_9BACT|nr:UDP-glucose 4-epimerase GalE [Bdellovibrio reynosensis]UOF01832.1 UDP-glucose 4-epimerase GalE [Bdellovibrio reynosensis]